MISTTDDDTNLNPFEMDIRALYERYGKSGFFSYMTDDGRSLGNLSSSEANRMGTLAGARDVLEQMAAKHLQVVSRKQGLRPARMSDIPRDDGDGLYA